MNLNKLTIENDSVDFKNKNIVMRVDYNVPLIYNEGQKPTVSSKKRIVATIPTIKKLLEKSVSRIVLISHMGRPNGRPNAKYSLAPVVPILSELLDMSVGFVEDYSKESIEKKAESLSGTQKIILMENVRFFQEEEGYFVDDSKNKIKSSEESVAAFRQTLTTFGDIYVNDAFGTCHRAHSSIVGIDLPFKLAGLLVKSELEAFDNILGNPSRPLLSIVGGSKISDKIQLIKNLLSKVQVLLIGGGMSYTFRKVIDNMSIGDSLFDANGAKIVPELMEIAKKNNVKIMLPVDYIIADDFSNDANTKIVSTAEGIPDKWSGLDVGPKTIEEFSQAVLDANTTIWNGPLGVFEMEKFSNGTKSVLKTLTQATENGKLTVVGGGDTATAAEMWGMESGISHVSTGGGASLELLEGKELPGITCLTDRN